MVIHQHSRFRMQQVLKTAFAFLLLTVSLSAAAQPADSSANRRLASLLRSYDEIKEGLVAGDSKATIDAASLFVENLNGISYQLISEGNVAALINDASQIMSGNDIAKQRALFANLSNNVIAVVRAVKPGVHPLYIQYCPMNKTYWISRDQSVRNPFLDSSMRSCGKVTETIQ